MDSNNMDQDEEAKSGCSDSNKNSDSGIKIDDFSPSSISDEISAEVSGSADTAPVAGAAVVPSINAKVELPKEEPSDTSTPEQQTADDNAPISVEPGSSNVNNGSNSSPTNSSSSSSNSAGSSGASRDAVATKRRYPNRVYRNRLRINSSSLSSSESIQSGDEADVPERVPRLNSTVTATGEDSNSQHESHDEREATDESDIDSTSTSDNHSDDSYSMSQYSDDDYDDVDVEYENHSPHRSTANEGVESEVLKELLGKKKPSYNWSAIHELMRREHGMDRNGRSVSNGLTPDFQMRYYASRHVVERMKLSHCLRKHTGCVNCLNFNKTGDLLCSGSDDTRIVVWDWAKNKIQHSFKSWHTENIFQTKFIDSVGCLDIISTSRDGQVRRAVVPPSGGPAQTSCLYKHLGAVHKVVVSPQNSAEIISVGEDGLIRSKDLRCENKGNEVRKMVTARKKFQKVHLYSVSHHPYAPEICVCGSDCFVRVYDKRNMKQLVHEMCPERLTHLPLSQITCCVYDNTGNEILASYSEDNIYLFDNRSYKPGSFLHQYGGHNNQRTIKGVNFFGPHSEYVISGSDCGNIFYWDKGTEAILNFMSGDSAGVVNCLEPNPKIPILATSGLEHNIKIWTPSSENYPPEYSVTMEKCIKRNLRRSVYEEEFDPDERQFSLFLRRFMRHTAGRRRMGRERNSRLGNSSDEHEEDNSHDILRLHWMRNSESSESSPGVEGYPQLDNLQCRTQ